MIQELRKVGLHKTYNHCFSFLILCWNGVKSNPGNKLRELKLKFNFLQLLKESRQQQNVYVNNLGSSDNEYKTCVSIIWKKSFRHKEKH